MIQEVRKLSCRQAGRNEMDWTRMTTVKVESSGWIWNALYFAFYYVKHFWKFILLLFIYLKGRFRGTEVSFIIWFNSQMTVTFGAGLVQSQTVQVSHVGAGKRIWAIFYRFSRCTSKKLNRRCLAEAVQPGLKLVPIQIASITGVPYPITPQCSSIIFKNVYLKGRASIHWLIPQPPITARSGLDSSWELTLDISCGWQGPRYPWAISDHS